MTRKLILLMALIFIGEAYAVVFELGGSFGYNKQVYGINRNNKITNRSYGASLAMYLFQYTALEFNVSNSENRTIEHEPVELDGYSLNIIGTNKEVFTDVYGIGLRQQLAPRGSLITPLISVGYAKQFQTGQTQYTFEDTSDNSILYQTFDLNKVRIDSVFGTLTIKFRLTKMTSLNASVNTVFKAFDFNKAQDNVKYRVGTSWFF